MRARYHPLAIPSILSSAVVYQTTNQFLQDACLIDAPLHLEIGSGKGQFIIQSATQHPSMYFIGVEQAAPVLFRALEKLDDHAVPNLKFIWGDADVWLNELSIPVERLYLQFSDPWPKARHEKRRLTHPSRLALYAGFVTGSVIVKTDNLEFYHYSLAQLEESAFRVVSHGILPAIDSMIQTEFEIKYRNLGKPIYYIEANR